MDVDDFVVLVDFKVILWKSLDNKELQEQFRNILVGFYSVLKSADPYLKLIFITGVTKFAQMSIFSTMNQLKDISLNKAYESICGMTATEIEANFAPELDEMAASNGISRTEIMKRMETMYDGYRFCEDQAQGMFNPSWLKCYNVPTSIYANWLMVSKCPKPLSTPTRPTRKILFQWFTKELRHGDVDAFMTRLRAFFGSMSYELSDDTERHYQAVFYIVLTQL